MAQNLPSSQNVIASVTGAAINILSNASFDDLMDQRNKVTLELCNAFQKYFGYNSGRMYDYWWKKGSPSAEERAVIDDWYRTLNSFRIGEDKSSREWFDQGPGNSEIFSNGMRLFGKWKDGISRLQEATEIFIRKYFPDQEEVLKSQITADQPKSIAQGGLLRGFTTPVLVQSGTPNPGTVDYQTVQPSPTKGTNPMIWIGLLLAVFVLKR